MIAQTTGDTLAVCPDRTYAVSTIGRHALLGREKKLPVCLILAEILPDPLLTVACGETVLTAMSTIFRSHLRPTDAIFRYRPQTVGMVLYESDQKGGYSVCIRLRRAVTSRLFFEGGSLTVVPIFGVSADYGYGPNPGEAMLSRAESALDGARHARDF